MIPLLLGLYYNIYVPWIYHLSCSLYFRFSMRKRYTLWFNIAIQHGPFSSMIYADLLKMVMFQFAMLNLQRVKRCKKSWFLPFPRHPSGFKAQFARQVAAAAHAAVRYADHHLVLAHEPLGRFVQDALEGVLGDRTWGMEQHSMWICTYK